MECHDDAVSPQGATANGRGECQRVNTAPDERLGEDKGR